VLARVNRAPLGTLRTLHDNQRKDSLTGLPLVHLGLALSMQGDKARGSKSIAEGFARNGKRPGYLGDYGSELRDDALMVALTHERGYAKPDYDKRVVSIGRELDARRNAGWLWLSTQEQIALARLGKALMADQKQQLSGRWLVGGIATDAPLARIVGRNFDHAQLASGIRFEPQGKAPLYASLEVAGIPRDAPVPDKQSIGIQRKWYGLDGKPWKPGPLREGDALIVGVSITAEKAMPDALLVDLLPAGLEIENFNLGDAGQWAAVVVDGIELSDRESAADVEHEEFRDDRYVAALSLHAGDTARVFYLVRAVTPGTYNVPPSLVEDMYRPELRGVGKSTPATITVVQPK
jgi:uncharacterized protein YfaS (alpha-2-macroglobulin family)